MQCLTSGETSRDENYDGEVTCAVAAAADLGRPLSRVTKRSPVVTRREFDPALCGMCCTVLSRLPDLVSTYNQRG